VLVIRIAKKFPLAEARQAQQAAELQSFQLASSASPTSSSCRKLAADAIESLPAERHDIHSIDPDLTRIWAIEAHQQTSKSALASAGAADDDARFRSHGERIDSASFRPTCSSRAGCRLATRRRMSTRIDEKFPRRDWLKMLAAAAGGFFILREGTGCSYYSAEQGDAFAPWAFPGGETRPEMIAARAALLAANPHNAQPWAVAVTTSNIKLHADFTRDTGTVDGLLREMYIGLGCALENLVIAAQSSGRAATVQILPDAADSSLVATVSLTPAAPIADPLFGVLARRHTNRGRYADAPPSALLLPALQSQIVDANVALTFLTSNADKAAFRTGTIDATNAFNADAQMSHDSNLWFRQSADDILQHRDGITLDCSGDPALTKFLGKSTGRPSDATANSYWLSATEGNQTTASAFCILSSPASSTRAHQLSVGRAYQRMHLWAVTQGLAMQPLNQMTELQDREETQSRPLDFTTRLNDLIGVPGRRAQMLFRIGYAWDDAPESPRRPLEWVLR